MRALYKPERIMLTAQQRAMIAKRGKPCGMNYRDRLTALYGIAPETATILAKPYKERPEAVARMKMAGLADPAIPSD